MWPCREWEMNESKFDELDEKILWELTRNARVSNSALSKMLDVSPATIHNRLRRLQSTGVWMSSHAEVDLLQLGFHVHALVSIRLKSGARANLSELLRKYSAKPHTVSAYALGGPTDLLVHVVCMSTSHLHEIVSREFNLDPDVGYTDTQVIFGFRRGAQHMEALSGYGQLRTENLESSRSFFNRG